MKSYRTLVFYILQTIFVRKDSSFVVGQCYDNYLQILNDVLSIPAEENQLVLHLDHAFPIYFQESVLNADEVRNTPHLLTNGLALTSVKTNVANVWVHNSFIIHVMFCFTHCQPMLESLWLYWKPHNVIIVNLDNSSNHNLLKENSLRDVKNIALIAELSPDADTHCDVVGLYTLYPFSSDSVVFISHWSKFLFTTWNGLFLDRFSTFDGYTFSLATWMNDRPFLYKSSSISNTNGAGVNLQVLQSLSSVLNFSYILTPEPPDLKWGIKLNGSWAGMLGMIARKEQNFSINNFFLSYERVQDFEPSTSYFEESTRGYLLHPEPLPEWMNIYRPFSFTVWSVILASLLLLLCVSYLQVRPVYVEHNLIVYSNTYIHLCTNTHT